MDLGPAHLPPYLPSLLRPLHGELSDSFHRAGPDLHTLAAEVVDLVKEVCGKEVFARAYADVQQTAVEARERRKKEAVMEVRERGVKQVEQDSTVEHVFKNVITAKLTVSPPSFLKDTSHLLVLMEIPPTVQFVRGTPGLCPLCWLVKVFRRIGTIIKQTLIPQKFYSRTLIVP